jgi:autophagy-related protein 9
MTSNILSRFLPPTGSTSIYEAIRQDDEASDPEDLEDRAAITLDNALHDSMDPTGRAARPPQTTSSSSRSRFFPSTRSIHRPRWMHPSPPPQVLEADEPDDDVPPSLLIEGPDDHDLHQPLSAPPPPHSSPPHHHHPSQLASGVGQSDRPLPPPSESHLQHRWDTVRARQPLHSPEPDPLPASGMPLPLRGPLPNLAAVHPRDKAMWRWTNVENLDNFLKDVYGYYLGNGIWCILLSRLLNLL